MAEGIVEKIWNVTVNKGERSGASQLASSIQYIENPEKVAMKMEEINFSQIRNELEYVKNELKTRKGLLVGGLRITDFSNATNEMMQVKKFFGKLDGRIALHGLISLDQEESTPESTGKLMLLLEEVLEQVFPMNQVVYAVHTNPENMHIHFIVNTVGVDGKKIHMDCNFMKKVLQPIVNEKAIKYGFTPNKKWSEEHKRESIPLPQRKMLLCKLIDHAIEEADFFAMIPNANEIAMCSRQIGIPFLKPAVKYCLLVIVNFPILFIVSINTENIISVLIGCVNDGKSGRT